TMLFSDTVYGPQAKMMTEYKEAMECDVMQIPFHGLGTGNTQLNLLLLYVKPEYVIMTGNENLGQVPNQDMMRDSTYQQIGYAKAKLYTVFPSDYPTKNSNGGTVKVTSDGDTYLVSYSN
ncbi:MAG: hypothetical protein PHU63_02915, partial [Candidatus ainarchaeum sp.]|nr:hypothetical protein [Candidatus ainarchaeum sp.]